MKKVILLVGCLFILISPAFAGVDEDLAKVEEILSMASKVIYYDDGAYGQDLLRIYFLKSQEEAERIDNLSEKQFDEELHKFVSDPNSVFLKLEKQIEYVRQNGEFTKIVSQQKTELKKEPSFVSPLEIN
jgi:hypothetical protein